MRCAFLLAAFTFLTACAAPQSPASAPAQPVDSAPPSDEPESDSDKKQAEASGSTAPVCQTANCQKACGAFSGDKLERCYRAWKNGCFTSSPDEGYDCGDARETFGVGEKEVLMGDP